MATKDLIDRILGEDSQKPLSKYRIERLQRLRERKTTDPDSLSEDDSDLLGVLEFYHSLELDKIELQLERKRELTTRQKADLKWRRGELRACIPGTPEWSEAWENFDRKEREEKARERRREEEERATSAASSRDYEKEYLEAKQKCDDYFNKEYNKDGCYGPGADEWAEGYLANERQAWERLHPSGDPTRFYW